MMIDKQINLHHAKEAATALLRWRMFLQAHIDVTDKRETKVLQHVMGALVDVEEAARIKLPDDVTSGGK